MRQREAAPLPPPETIPLAVVACYDPRLDPMILPALGLGPGQALVLRAAGALLRPEDSALRSLALGTYLFGVTGVVVLGHSSCRMAQFDAPAFIESFRRRGVRREAFGPQDLREWSGAIPDPKRGVAASVAAIHGAPFLPPDLSVAGLVLDDRTGALEVVVRPGEHPAAGAVAPAAEAPTGPAAAEPGGPAPPEPPAAPPRPERGLADAAQAFLALLAGKARWGAEFRRLRQELEHERNPITKLRMLERFARAASTESRELGEAFERLKREAVKAKGRLDPEELVRRILRKTG